MEEHLIFCLGGLSLFRLEVANSWEAVAMITQRARADRTGRTQSPELYRYYQLKDKTIETSQLHVGYTNVGRGCLGVLWVTNEVCN